MTREPLFGLIFMNEETGVVDTPLIPSVNFINSDLSFHKYLRECAAAAGGSVTNKKIDKPMSRSRAALSNEYLSQWTYLLDKETVEVVLYHFVALAGFAVFARNLLGSIKDGLDIGEKLRAKRPMILLGDKLIPYDGQDIVKLVEDYKRRTGADEGDNNPP